MADIRIKDLATTATTTASGDFMAVDGTTNGTRKLSATAPAFLTSVTTPSLTSPAATDLTLAGGSSGASLVLGQGTGASLKLIPTTSGSVLLGNITPSLYDTDSGSDVSQFWNFKSSLNVGAGTAGYTQGAVAATSFFGGWRVNTSGKAIIAAYQLTGLLVNTAGSETGYLDVYTKPSTGAAANVARWTPTGNLLIGTTSETGLTGAGGLKINSSTAGSSGAGALVVQGGLATGAASYFGGAVTVNGAGSTNYGTANSTLNLTRASTPAGNFVLFQGRTAYDTYIGTIGTAAGIATTNDDLVIGQKGNAPTFAITPSTGAATFAGAVSVGSATDATNSTSGSFQTLGGAGIAKALFTGGSITGFGGSITSAGVSSPTFVASSSSDSSYSGTLKAVYSGTATMSLLSRTITVFSSGGIDGTKVFGGDGTLAATFVGANATFAGAVAIGNSTAASVAAPSTHKVSILIGGVQYYLLASNV